MYKLQFTVTVISDVDNQTIAEEDAADLADILYEDARMYAVEGMADIIYDVLRVYEIPDYLMEEDEEEDDFELDPEELFDISDEDGV